MLKERGGTKEDREKEGSERSKKKKRKKRERRESLLILHFWSLYITPTRNSEIYLFLKINLRLGVREH